MLKALFPRTDRRRRSRRTLAVLASVSMLAAVGVGTADAMTIDPAADSLAGNYLAARFAGQQSDMAASARYFAEALSNDPDDPYLLERTFALTLASGDVETGFDYGRRLMAEDLDNRLSSLALGVEAIERGNWAVAVERLKPANVGPLAGLTVEVLSAWAEAGGGNTKKALARLDKLSGEDWYSFFRSYHGGLIAEVSGDSQEAVKRLGQAFALDPGNVRVTDAFIRALARAGNVSEARRVLNEGLSRAPGHPLLEAISAELDKGAPDPLVSSPKAGAAEILAGLGAAIGRDDTGELAAIYLQLALHLDSSADLARLSLAEIFERSRQYERSIEVLNGVPTDSPLKRNAEIQIGFDYNALDKVDEARQHLEKLVQDDPSELDAVTALGNVLRVRKIFDEAATVYSAGIDTLDDPQPQHWSLFYYRGIAYERTRRWPEAEADFRKALILAPDQPLVLNYLGYSLVDRGEKLNEALKMIEKAVELEPTDGYIVDSLGWVYYKLGRYEEAVEQLERAVELRPEDPVINDHLGDAYWRVGRKLEARFQWAHARDREPEPEELVKILNKLTNGLEPVDQPAAADAGSAAGVQTEKN